ncbi:MAG: exodeoxyribonuclease III [Arachnia sp.]
MARWRLGTHNVNGIRASVRRGFTRFWTRTAADAVALQEVRCRADDLPPDAFGQRIATLDLGQQAGRNGVAILTRQPPANVRSLSGSAITLNPGGSPTPIQAQRITSRDLAKFADEGRYLEVDLADVPIRVASLYLPKGAAWPYEADLKDKYDRKMRFMRGLARLLTLSRREAAAQGLQFVVSGDFNVAHEALDLKNWRANQKSEGFLPEERSWFSSVVGSRRLVDVVRLLHPKVNGPYSWWSWRGQAFTNDAGWRIDYQLASPSLAGAARRAWVAREATYEARMSDHSPVLVDYDLDALLD